MAAVAWPRRVPQPPAGDKQVHHVHNGATGVSHAALCRPRLLAVPQAARAAVSNPERSTTCLQVKPPHRHAMSARAEHQPAASAPTSGLAGMPSNNRDVGVIHLWCGGKSQLCWHRPCACTLQLRQHGCEDHRALKLPPHNVHSSRFPQLTRMRRQGEGGGRGNSGTRPQRCARPLHRPPPCAVGWP